MKRQGQAAPFPPGTQVPGFFFLFGEEATMAKTIPMHERKTQVISMVPVSVREQLDRLAYRERVSVSEHVRRALSEYVGKRKAG
jgi:ribbon-helix-helix CopG family protein